MKRIQERSILNEMNEKPQDEKADVATWLKRVGVIGFLFFLIKGLLWLIVPALIYYFY